MKKIYYLLLAGMLVTLCACGGSEDTPSEEAVLQTEASQEAQSEAASEEAKEPVNDRTLELGKAIKFKDFEITIKSFSITKDYDGNPALKYVYDWTNLSDEPSFPFMTFVFKGYQDGVETDDAIFTEEVDLEIGQKEVKGGATITDAEGAIGISSMDKPLDLELEESFAFDSNPYTITIDPGSL